MKNKVLLIILDGWGIAQPWGGNAIAVAQTPYFDYLWREYPHTQLKASGVDVGLPGHEMGNSEVGHLNIGAGRIVNQDILHINEVIEDGTFFKNKVLIEAMNRVKNTSNNLHLMGIISDGGIHGHINHAIALLYMAQLQGVKNVYIHLFTDGRDSPPMSAQHYISRLKQEINKLKTGTIATISGRYYAMDRNKNWTRTDRVYKALTQGIGHVAPSAIAAVAEAYTRGETDEFIQPTIVARNGVRPPTIKNNDSIIFWNFRSDRARQLTQAFLKPKIEEYPERKLLTGIYFVSLIPYGYEADIGVRPYVAFTPDKITTTLASVLAQNKMPQFHIAETEKYAHVTYFLNGTIEKPYPGETRQIIPSPAVATYDLKPEMSAPMVGDAIVKAMQTAKYPFIVANFANTDMVAHSGKFNAIVAACEAVDRELRKVVETAKKLQYHTIVTADHGNAEQTIDPLTNQPSTEHTRSLVPFILVPPPEDTCQHILRTSGRLADIAPTILSILNINKPPQMTGNNLVAISRNGQKLTNGCIENK